MNDMTILQVPISKALKKSALEAATDQGFSSVQEMVRVFLHKFAKRQIRLNIEEMPVIKLSKSADKRYDKMIKEIKDGKGIVYNNFDEFKKMIDNL